MGTTGQPVRRPRVGSVSYLNSKPLIFGLESDPSVALSLAVPAKLIDGLRDGALDVALLPVIDYQRLGGLTILPAGGIGCDGPTLTVRIFSRTPVEQIRTLACDVESHTSVALVRIILAERYGLRPEFVDLRRGDAPAHAARLLIGDKVVCAAPADMPHQLDLGAAWKAMTGRPFLFAARVARDGVDFAFLCDRLRRAKAQGMGHIAEIVARHAVPQGWPADLARRYMTEYLKYDVGPAQLDAVRHFHALAAKHGIIPSPPRELVVFHDVFVPSPGAPGDTCGEQG